MKKAIVRHIILLVFVILAVAFLASCKSKIRYVPVETIKIEKETELLRDTVVDIKLVPYFVEKVVDADSSYLENEYAFSFVRWDGRFLHHNLGIKDFRIPVNIQYKDRWHTKVDSVPYPVEVFIKGDVVYKMKWYEEIFFYVGIIVALIGGVYGGFRLIKKKLVD